MKIIIALDHQLEYITLRNKFSRTASAGDIFGSVTNERVELLRWNSLRKNWFDVSLFIASLIHVLQESQLKDVLELEGLENLEWSLK